MITLLPKNEKMIVEIIVNQASTSKNTEYLLIESHSDSERASNRETLICPKLKLDCA